MMMVMMMMMMMMVMMMMMMMMVMMMMMMVMMMMITKLRSTKHVLSVLSRRKQHPVPMGTATSFPESLILPPLERAPSAPRGGKMRDPGNEVLRTVANGRKFTTYIDVTWLAPILTNQGQLCMQVLDEYFPHFVSRQSMYAKPQFYTLRWRRSIYRSKRQLTNCSGGQFTFTEL